MKYGSDRNSVSAYSALAVPVWSGSAGADSVSATSAGSFPAWLIVTLSLGTLGLAVGLTAVISRCSLLSRRRTALRTLSLGIALPCRIAALCRALCLLPVAVLGIPILRIALLPIAVLRIPVLRISLLSVAILRIPILRIALLPIAVCGYPFCGYPFRG